MKQYYYTENDQTLDPVPIVFALSIRDTRLRRIALALAACISLFILFNNGSMLLRTLHF